MIEYDIIPGDKTNSSHSVGKIKNICRDCHQECLTKADRFGIDFPKSITNKQKMLIIMASIWLNYL